jgi:hypothetical protein
MLKKNKGVNRILFKPGDHVLYVLDPKYDKASKSKKLKLQPKLVPAIIKRQTKGGQFYIKYQIGQVSEKKCVGPEKLVPDPEEVYNEDFEEIEPSSTEEREDVNSDASETSEEEETSLRQKVFFLLFFNLSRHQSLGLLQHK